MLSAAAEEEKQERAFAVPELEYNLKLLLDLSESEIIQIDRQYVHGFTFSYRFGAELSYGKLILSLSPLPFALCHLPFALLSLPSNLASNILKFN